MSLAVDDYTCPTGLVGCGGCGANILGQTVVGLDPEDFPDFKLLCIDTDARTQRHNFTQEEQEVSESFKKWEEARALIVHTLGKCVTGKRGAGADPAKGRAAAESPESQEVIKSFLEKVDTVLIVGSAGGGTGAGVMPVVARMAKEMGKVVMARVIMPGPFERRTARATKALNEIRAIVPTFKFDNGYLDEFLEKYVAPEQRESIPRKAAYRLMDKRTLVRELFFLKEIIQSTGDMNLDTADLGTILEGKTDGIFGVVEIDPQTQLSKLTPEVLAQEMFTLPFQDESIVGRGQIAGFYTHGPWPVKLADGVAKIIGDRITGGDTSREPEIIHGSLDDVSDERMWMGVIITAGPEPLASKAPASELESFDEEVGPLSVIRFLSGGEEARLSVPASFSSRFNRIHGSIHSSKNELEKLFDEVEKRGGVRPDLPLRLREKPVKKAGFWDPLLGALAAMGFRKKMV